MNLSIRDYAKVGVRVKRFSYTSEGQVLIVKPKKGQEFILHEDYLGSHSLLWIVCSTKDGELWRHSITNVTRITFFEETKIQ